MHIGRASTVPPEELREQAHIAQARVLSELRQLAPAAVSRASAPTGETRTNLPTYNPVIDLIHRLPQAAAGAAAPPPPSAQLVHAYEGTPPPPAVMDMTA